MTERLRQILGQREGLDPKSLNGIPGIWGAEEEAVVESSTIGITVPGPGTSNTIDGNTFVVDADSDADDDSEDDDSETFDRAYVEKLRTEAKKYRVRANETESELTKYRDAERTDLEKAQARADEVAAENEALKARMADLERTQRIQSVASTLNFIDPADAIALIDIESLTADEDGFPTRKSIKGALEKVAKEKAYLVQDPGSADGGAKGTNPGKPNRIETRTEELVRAGRIPIS